jgi:hypothetical protein
MSAHLDVRLAEAMRQLNVLQMLKFVLPAHALREACFAKVLSKVLYTIEFTYPRLSTTERERLERLVNACARLITGGCKNARTDLLLPGMPSFDYVATKRVVVMDEKLIEQSPDFDEATGVYAATPWTRADLAGVRSVKEMASCCSPRSRTATRTRAGSNPSARSRRGSI